MFVTKITYFNVHKLIDDYLGQLQNDVKAGAPTKRRKQQLWTQR